MQNQDTLDQLFGELSSASHELGSWVRKHPRVSYAVLQGLEDRDITRLKTCDLSDNQTVVTEMKRWRNAVDEYLGRLRRSGARPLAELLARYPGVAFMLLEQTSSFGIFASLSETDRQRLYDSLKTEAHSRVVAFVDTLQARDVLGSSYPEEANSIVRSSEYRIAVGGTQTIYRRSGWRRFLVEGQFDEADIQEALLRLRELIERLRQHCDADQEASLDAFVELYTPKIWRIVRSFHLAEQETEDCLCLVYAHFVEDGYRVIRQWNPAQARHQFLETMVRYIVFNYLNTPAAQPGLEIPEDMPDPQATPIDYDDLLDLRMAVDHMIQNGMLNEKQVAVLQGKWRGLSALEIAEALGITEANVNTIFSRTLRQILQFLHGRSGTDTRRTRGPSVPEDGLHLSTSQLRDYLDDRLSPEVLPELEAHLIECPYCLGALEQAAGIHQELLNAALQLALTETSEDADTTLWLATDDPRVLRLASVLRIGFQKYGIVPDPGLGTLGVLLTRGEEDPVPAHLIEKAKRIMRGEPFSPLTAARRPESPTRSEDVGSSPVLDLRVSAPDYDRKFDLTIRRESAYFTIKLVVRIMSGRLASSRLRIQLLRIEASARQMFRGSHLKEATLTLNGIPAGAYVLEIEDLDLSQGWEIPVELAGE